MSTQRFPEPSRLVRYAFGELQVAESGTGQEKGKQLGEAKPVALPRPWDPPSCPPTLLTTVWGWLDEVAGWINHEYGWQFDRMIPSCWPAHPHIAHELAVLACLRHFAGLALTPAELEDWHRYALPGFLDRMAARLGNNGCPPGKHTDWPGISRHKDYLSPAAKQRRSDAFAADTKSCDPAAAANGAGRDEHLAPAVLGSSRPRIERQPE